MWPCFWKTVVCTAKRFHFHFCFYPRKQPKQMEGDRLKNMHRNCNRVCEIDWNMYKSSFIFMKHRSCQKIKKQNSLRTSNSKSWRLTSNKNFGEAVFLASSILLEYEKCNQRHRAKQSHNWCLLIYSYVLLVYLYVCLFVRRTKVSFSLTN